MEFIRLPSFEKSAKGLLSESDILEMEEQLVSSPQAGDVIPGARGLRKLRRPAKGRGKRGDSRIIYYFVSHDDLILLIFAYPKNKQSDLTPTQLKLLSTTVHSEFP